MNILVTGGAGYIGSITARKLSEEGNNVIVYDNLVKGHRASVTTTFVQGCLSNKELLGETFKKFNIEAVFHFAGFIEAGDSMKHPFEFFQNNVFYGVNLLDVMVKNNVKKIIFSSSAAVYKPSDKPLKEDDIKEPENFYGETKLMFEKILEWYDKAYGIKFIALRYFNATGCEGELGERHNPETHLVPLAILTALGCRENIKIFGTNYETFDGTCVRDYVHVKDLAEVHILALKKLNEKSGVFNVGTGDGISVRQVIDSVRNLTGKNFTIIETEKRLGDPKILIADPSKIKREFGWSAKIDFKRGLEENIEYFKKNIFSY